MAKAGGRTLRIIGTAPSDAAAGKVAGEPVILVGDTTSLKGTQGATGAAGPVWAPTVGDVGDADGAAATGSIEVEAGVFILTYDAAA